MLLVLAPVLARPATPYAGEAARGFTAVVHRSNCTQNLPFGNLLSLFEGVSRQWPNRSGLALAERGEEAVMLSIDGKLPEQEGDRLK